MIILCLNLFYFCNNMKLRQKALNFRLIKALHHIIADVKNRNAHKSVFNQFLSRFFICVDVSFCILESLRIQPVFRFVAEVASVRCKNSNIFHCDSSLVNINIVILRCARVVGSDSINFLPPLYDTYIPYLHRLLNKGKKFSEKNSRFFTYLLLRKSMIGNGILIFSLSNLFLTKSKRAK